MRYVGRITEWNDAKGYGFITPNGGGDRVFVHIKAFERRQGRPDSGVLVSYEPARDAKGRFSATNVRLAERTRGKGRSADPRARFPRKAAAACALGALALGWRFLGIPTAILLAYATMSVLALILYGIDKSAAKANRWRTPESTLHLVALLGGWPGALFAQDLFRHKSSKTAFQVVFWSTVALNLAGLAWLLMAGDVAAPA